MFIPLFTFLICTLIFSTILFIVSALLMTPTNQNFDKFDLYECGFKAFETAKEPIEIQFFLLAILFVIFDLETVYLIPWAVNFFIFGWSSLLNVFIFLFILIVGYIYEFKEGLLDWALLNPKANS